MLGMNIVLEAQSIARERKNGEEPSHDETGAVVHEICQNALSEIALTFSGMYNLSKFGMP